MERWAETLYVGVIDERTVTPAFPDGSEQRVSSPVSPLVEAQIDEIYVDSSDAEKAHEHDLGDYEYLPFKPDGLVSLSQIRGERNIVTNELKEDILFQGLINPIDVSLVSYELLDEYIQFTNRTWGSEAKIEDYMHLQLPDGRFPLLKSGHSRHTAVTELIEEKKLSQDTRIWAKISEAESVFDIVQWQRGENIHSQPPRERTAMGLVESYLYGVEKGEWHNEEEFIAIQESKGRKVKKGPLAQALKYSRLAPHIRNFILAGEVPYLAGVEMGASVDILTEYVARMSGFNGVTDPRLTSEQKSKIQKTVVIELDIMCNRITNDNLNSTASQKYIQGKRNLWSDVSRSMRPNNKKIMQGLDSEFKFAQDALDINYIAKVKELKRALADTKTKYAGHDIPKFLKLQQGILPEADIQELLLSFEEELVKTRQALGSYTTTVASHESDLFSE